MALISSAAKRLPHKSTVEPTSAAQRATSYDVAIAAGVAQSTVSRCFQTDSPIADTRAHVIAIAGQLGYRPNALARSLILGRSNVVGVIVTRYTLRYNPELLYALGEALTAQSAKLLLIAVDNDDAVHSTLYDALEFPLDGLISCATMTDDDIASFRAAWRAHRVPEPVCGIRRRGLCRHRQCPGGTSDCGRALSRWTSTICLHRRPTRRTGKRGTGNGFVGRLRDLGVTDLCTVASDFSYDGGRAAFNRRPARSRNSMLYSARTISLRSVRSTHAG